MSRSSLRLLLGFLQTCNPLINETMNLLDRTILVILSVSLTVILWELIGFCWGMLGIKTGVRIPKAITNFPVYQETAQSKYNLTREKVEKFVEQTLDGESSSLILSGNELNTLITKGYMLDVYKPGTYLCYLIEQDWMIEKFLRWPSLPGIDACWTRTARIRFKNDELESPQELYQILEEAGREKKGSEFIRKLDNSGSMLFILGLSESPYFLLNTDPGTVNYQRGKSVLDSIKKISIENHHIYIST
jgi:hypothetical protein